MAADGRGHGKPRLIVYLIKVGLYLLVAAACLTAFKNQKRREDDGGIMSYVAAFRSCVRAIGTRGLRAPPLAWRAMGWFTVAVLCVGLALMRLVDIDVTVRGAAMSEDWYAARAPAQVALVITFAVAGIGTCVAAMIVMRKSPPLAGAFAAVTALWFFVAVRVVSFHAVDRVLGAPVLGLTVNAWCEGVGMAAIVATVMWEKRRPLDPLKVSAETALAHRD